MSTNAKCCGKDREGRFCSECGKELAISPLIELYEQCRRTEQSLIAKAARDRKDKQSGRGEKAAKALEKNAAKWKAWAEAVEEVIWPTSPSSHQ